MGRHSVGLPVVAALCAVLCTNACSLPAEKGQVKLRALPERTGMREEAVEGEEALVFEKKDGAASGKVQFPEGVTELWMRARFPWPRGSDALEVSVDDKSLGKLDARNVDGMWDNGNFQVWHWRRLSCQGIAPGEHLLKVSAADCTAQSFSQIMLTSGAAWSRPWLGGPDAVLSQQPDVPLFAGKGAFVVEAEAAPAIRGQVIEIHPGGKKGVRLGAENNAVAAVFETREPVEAELWVRLFFEGENNYEGHDLREMDPAALVEMDGELLLMHHILDGWRWHWEQSAKVKLEPGRHLLRIANKNCSLRVDKAVLYPGADATAQDWYREQPAHLLPFGLRNEVPFDAAARAKGWRAFGALAGKAKVREEGGQLLAEVPADEGELFLERSRSFEQPTGRRAEAIEMPGKLQAGTTAEAVFAGGKGDCWKAPLEPKGDVLAASFPAEAQASGAWFMGLLVRSGGKAGGIRVGDVKWVSRATPAGDPAVKSWQGQMEIIGRCPVGFGVPGSSSPIIMGNTCILTAGEGNLTIMDISDPRQPSIVGYILSWYFSSSYFPMPPFAFFESSRRGLVVIDDMTDYTCPGRLRDVPLDRAKYGRLCRMFSDARIGVFSGAGSLFFFDLSDPLAPREVAKIEGASWLWSDADKEGMAWTELSDEVLARVDLSQPARPALKEKVTRPKGSGLMAVGGDDFVLRVGNEVWLARRAGDKIEKVHVFPGFSSRCILANLRGEYLDLIDGRGGSGQYSLSYRSAHSRWAVFRRNAPAEALSDWEAPYPSAFSAMTIEGKVAYVFDYNYGLHTFDLSDPAKPKPLGGCMSAGEGHYVTVQGDRAYISQTFGGGITILDISDPTNPRRTGECWDGCWFLYHNRVHTQMLGSAPGALYVAKQGDGIHVFDIAQPDSPRDIGKIDGSFFIVSGNNLIAATVGKVLVYDISKPLAPALASAAELPDAKAVCQVFAVEKNLLCAAEGDGRTNVFTIDIQDPRSARALGQLDLKDCEGAAPVSGGIALADGFLYLAPVRTAQMRDNTMLIVVDVRKPAAPKFVRMFDPYPPGLPNASNSTWANFYGDLVVSRGYLFAGNYGQIECFDISKPGKPEFVGLCNTGFQWSAGVIRDGLLYVPALVGLDVVRVPQK